MYIAAVHIIAIYNMYPSTVLYNPYFKFGEVTRACVM